MLLGIVLSAALLALAGCSSDDETVATYDGGKVTKEDLYQELVSSYGEQGINMLVSDEIAKKEAKKLKVTVSKEQLDDALKSYTAQFGSDEAFKEMLDKNNMSEDEFKSKIKEQLLLENLLKERIQITDEEMKTYFEGNKEQFNQGEEVKASHILVETEEEANDLLTQLNEGADFAELAKKHSKDTNSAIEGGDLGFFGKGLMVKEFEEVAFSLAIGELSGVVKSEHGFHIIKVTEKKDAVEATFDDSKEAIKETLIYQKMQTEYSTWLEEKFAEYKLESKLK